jgi:hypothetical protein
MTTIELPSNDPSRLEAVTERLSSACSWGAGIVKVLFPTPDNVVRRIPLRFQLNSIWSFEIRDPSLRINHASADARTTDPGEARAFPRYHGGVYVSASHTRLTTEGVNVVEPLSIDPSGNWAATATLFWEPRDPACTVVVVSPKPLATIFPSTDHATVARLKSRLKFDSSTVITWPGATFSGVS